MANQACSHSVHLNTLFQIQREAEVTCTKQVISYWRHCGHAPWHGDGDRDCLAAQKGWIRLWWRNHSSFFIALQSQLGPLVSGERSHRSDLRTGEYVCTMSVRGLYLFSSQKGDDEVTLLSLHLPGEKSLGISQEGQSKDLWLMADRQQPELSHTFIMAEWLATETTNKENVWFFFSWILFTWQTQGIWLTVSAGGNVRARCCQVIRWYPLGLGMGDMNRISSP